MVLACKNPPKSCLLRPEQKNLCLIGDLVHKFLRLGTLVVDVFRGAFVTAKSYLMTQQHLFLLKLTRIVSGSRSVQVLVEMYARQLLNPKSDISVSE